MSMRGGKRSVKSDERESKKIEKVIRDSYSEVNKAIRSNQVMLRQQVKKTPPIKYYL